MNKANPSYQSNYRAEIDGLRAFSVLSVIAFHAFPSRLTGGFVGVDVFFVISGFLITSHIFENLDKGKFSFADFFGRRVRRIFPSLILVMASSLIFGWFVLLSDEYAQLGKHVASGAAFIVNFILVNESGYFDNAAETKPLLHLWSLAVEEQFYIIWPLVLWLAAKRKFNLLTITIVVALVSFYLNMRLVQSKPAEAFFWPVGRFWELLSGSILAWLMLYKRDGLRNIRLWADKHLVGVIYSEKKVSDGSLVANAMSLLGLLLLLYGVIRIDEDMPFPSTWALFPILGAVLVISAGSKAWLNRVFLMNPVAVWFGLISYPLYLWHWPVLSFLQIINGEIPHRDGRIIAVLVSILLAWLTYKFVEKPIRFGVSRKRNTMLLVLVIALVGAVGWYIHKTGGQTPYNLQLKMIAEAKDDWTYPDGLVRKENRLRATSDEPSSVLFFGDSHIEAFGPRIVDMYDRGLIKEVAFVAMGGCAPVPNTFRGDRYIEICTRHFDDFRIALEENPIRTIILGGSYGKYFGRKGSYYLEGDKKYPSDTEEGTAKAMNAFLEFIEELDENYEVVVLSQATAADNFAPENIISGSDRRPIPLTADIRNEPFSIDRTLEMEVKSAVEALGVPFVSQSAKVCPDNICYPLTDDGRPKYKDVSHMRPFFVIEYMDILDEYILKQD